MIIYNGYEKIIDTIYKNKQEHVFKYWDELAINERKILFDELQNVDFDLMNRLFQQKRETSAGKLDFKPAHFISLPGSGNSKEDHIKAEKIGKEYISEGKIAVLLVAGGQGTRLGFDGPKGLVPVGPVSGKSLFQIHAEKILKYSRKYKISIPWLIMTSKDNHEDTVEYFNKNKYFGFKKEDVFFFSQKMIPSLDLNGKLMLKIKNSLCMNPDGHGGTLSALYSSGLLEELNSRKIETISYFQVDNPLVKIVDPVFIGFHIMNNSDVSSKGVMKTAPDEKVGVFVKFNNGRTGIVEYSDIPREKQIALDADGKLLYCMGSTAIHLFKRAFIESITGGNHELLPYHIAQKKINAFCDGKETEVNGLKYEKFIFDALTLTDKSIILEILREEDFAPIKNASGADSIDAARELLSKLHRKWLREKGIAVPDNIQIIEISPLLAVEAEDLPAKILIPAKEKVYLE